MLNNSVIVRYLKILKCTTVDTHGLYRKRSKKLGVITEIFSQKLPKVVRHRCMKITTVHIPPIVWLCQRSH